MILALRPTFAVSLVLEAFTLVTSARVEPAARASSLGLGRCFGRHRVLLGGGILSMAGDCKATGSQHDKRKDHYNQDPLLDYLLHASSSPHRKRQGETVSQRQYDGPTRLLFSFSIIGEPTAVEA